MNFIEVPDKYRLETAIPKEKFNSESINDAVKEIFWTGNIKQAISGVKPVVSDSIRYEEIQIFHCEVYYRQQLFSILHDISKAIKYPSIIEFQVEEATAIGICEFRPNKNDNTLNVIKEMRLSHWLRKDILSPEAQKMIECINDSLKKKTDMKDIYSSINKAISDWKMGGTSRAHVDRIIVDLIGKGQISPSKIRQYCIPFEYHAIVPGQNKYSKQKRESNYTLVHDYEEIWYCLMKCEETKRVIERRRYNGVQDLFYSIDSKGW